MKTTRTTKIAETREGTTVTVIVSDTVEVRMHNLVNERDPSSTSQKNSMTFGDLMDAKDFFASVYREVQKAYKDSLPEHGYKD